MSRKALVGKIKGKSFSKAIQVMEDPKNLAPLTNHVAWKILLSMAETPSYPNELARRLKINEQLVYYHVKKLLAAGIVEAVREEYKRGAVCRYYAPVAKAFGIELPGEGDGYVKETSKVKTFLHEFIKNGTFSGSIVVGSPVPHGPFLTEARDGHYSVQMGAFLGNFCTLGNRFIVKLDTEVKAEKKEKRNLILIGGPVTNIVTADLNEHLKIRFKWVKTWSIFSEATKKEYGGETDGLIAKVKNPWDHSKSVLMLAGLKFEGTKACILALTQKHEEILKDFERSKEFYRIVRGLDKDGDGKVDDVEVLE